MEATQIRTSIMKVSMKMSLFQWSQLEKYPEWIAIIEAWWGKFKVSTYIINTFNIYIYIYIYIYSCTCHRVTEYCHRMGS
jgi:hypothetical protein